MSKHNQVAYIAADISLIKMNDDTTILPTDRSQIIGPTLSPYDEYVFTTILFVIHYILDLHSSCASD
jgi:hypothetical protein